MNIFLIMWLKILIVLTLRTFTSNWYHNLTSIILNDINCLFVLQNFTWKFPFFTRPQVPYECISSIIMNISIDWWVFGFIDYDQCF